MFANMGITANDRRTDHQDDAAKPRSQQTAVGPSQAAPPAHASGLRDPRHTQSVRRRRPAAALARHRRPRRTRPNPRRQPRLVNNTASNSPATASPATSTPTTTPATPSWTGSSSAKHPCAPTRANGPSQQYQLAGTPLRTRHGDARPRRCQRRNRVHPAHAGSRHRSTSRPNSSTKPCQRPRCSGMRRSSYFAETDGPATLPPHRPLRLVQLARPTNPRPDRACSGHITQQQGARA